MKIIISNSIFKLIILRMIAPIPVISYIEPKSAKDGAFSHWTKTFISTWAELFINLALIYFIVYMIDMLTVSDTWQMYFNKNIFRRKTISHGRDLYVNCYCCRQCSFDAEYL